MGQNTSEFNLLLHDFAGEIQKHPEMFYKLIKGNKCSLLE